MKPGFEASEELEKKISDAICREIGKIAKPRRVWIVKDMPKTRSGKIMRRVLAAISNKTDVGDVTTLANPEIVEDIRKMAEIAEHGARGGFNSIGDKVIPALARRGCAAHPADLQTILPIELERGEPAIHL